MMKLSKAIEGFVVDRQAARISPNTIKIYQWTFARVYQYLGDDPPLEQISAERLQSFYVWLQQDYEGGHLSPSSVEKAWSTLRSFYRWAERALGAGREDRLLSRPRYSGPEVQPYTEQQVRDMLRCCLTTRMSTTETRKPFTMRRATAHRDQAIVYVLLDTGIRVGELARLCVQDVNIANGEVFVAPFGTGVKTTSRHVWLGKQALKSVWRHMADADDLHERDPLFLSRMGRPMDKDSVRRLIAELGDRAGVPNAHPHRFRHTFAVQFLRNGGDVFTLQRLLGHSTLKMVQHYLALVKSDLQETHRRSSPADRWHL